MILSANLQRELYLRDSFDVMIRTVNPVNVDSELGQLMTSLGVRGIDGKRTILTGTLDKSGICSLMALHTELERYDEMFEDEPSHENMFGIGQDVAAEAASLAGAVEELQFHWNNLWSKWNPTFNVDNPQRIDQFVKEFERHLFE